MREGSRMTSPAIDTRDAIEAVLRFNTPYDVPKKSLALGFKEQQVVTPTAYAVLSNGDRKKYQVRTFQDVFGLALGGDIDYSYGDYLELRWANDGIGLKLKLIPQVCSHEKLVFHGTLSLYHSSHSIIRGLPFRRAIFYADRDLTVPNGILKLLESNLPSSRS